MKQLFTGILSLIIAMSSFAAEHVSWTYKLIGDKTSDPAVEITASIDPGFHLYSLDNPEGGAGALEFHFTTEGCKLSGTPKANKAYTKAYNDIFEVNEHFYSGTVKFTQKIKPTAANYKIKLEINGQVCDDQGC